MKHQKRPLGSSKTYHCVHQKSSLPFVTVHFDWGYVENCQVFPASYSCQAGRRAVPIDLEIGGASMDLTTDIGFSNCLYHACNLREGAACMAAPVCGSFVFMKRGNISRQPVLVFPWRLVNLHVQAMNGRSKEKMLLYTVLPLVPSLIERLAKESRLDGAFSGQSNGLWGVLSNWKSFGFADAGDHAHLRS